MREITAVRELGTLLWEVVIRLPNGHTTYRLKSRDRYPDQLSVYMRVARELDEEQNNGTTA